MSEFFSEIYTFITSGLYDFYTALTAYFTDYAKITFYEFATASVNFTSDLVFGFTKDINATGQFVKYWNSIPADIRAMLTAARIPDCIAIVGGAYGVRFAMKTLGF